MANEKFNIFMISIRESKYLLTQKKYVSEETWISWKSIRLKNKFATMKLFIYVLAIVWPQKIDFNYSN